MFIDFTHIKRSLLTYLLLVTTLTFYHSTSVFAINMICAIPKRNDQSYQSNAYLELLEPKTVMQLDINEKVSKFNSPGCNKFQSVSSWNGSFLIKCNSNNGGRLHLKVNKQTLQFTKTYFKNNNKKSVLRGFCEKRKAKTAY